MPGDPAARQSIPVSPVRVPRAAVVGSVICALLALACPARQLRGEVERSPDGQTYLTIADDNGGACGPLEVDGQPWRHAVGERGRIAPGVHRIGCGDGPTLEIEVARGTVFTFDYWGP